MSGAREFWRQAHPIAKRPQLSRKIASLPQKKWARLSGPKKRRFIAVFRFAWTQPSRGLSPGRECAACELRDSQGTFFAVSESRPLEELTTPQTLPGSASPTLFPRAPARSNRYRNLSGERSPHVPVAGPDRAAKLEAPSVQTLAASASPPAALLRAGRALLVNPGRGRATVGRVHQSPVSQPG